MGCCTHASCEAAVRRAVFHFISQTLLRVPRYRIYLVLYGGVGLSVLIATVLRLTVSKGHLRAEASADGIRVALGIVAFWVIAGMRTAFVSPGNQQGNWVFRIHAWQAGAISMQRWKNWWRRKCGYCCVRSR